MKEQKKILGEDRRNLILQILFNRKEPITGGELAALANVSRQVIVGDITLLKAKNEPILATSQGYLYLPSPSRAHMFEQIIACYHSTNKTEDELNLLVDHGVTVKDVKVEHPVYGDITASIMVSNRREVQLFMKKVRLTNAAYLADLTDGFHLHSITAPTQRALNEASKAMKEANYLLDI
ncbi:transcription repressor NadR [Mesobacillus harenae]|uniref:transcription repressor NadR n=1 Tax=Mesobacillus harenae TaxID=2213203 RepID=UPI001580200A|nr:transcription repressor NadR [Mesobacillus harenae]